MCVNGEGVYLYSIVAAVAATAATAATVGVIFGGAVALCLFVCFVTIYKHVFFCVQFHLVKKEDARWNYLVRNTKEMKHFVCVDWNRWIDEDDEISNDHSKPDFDMNGFGGGENMQEMIARMAAGSGNTAPPPSPQINDTIELFDDCECVEED